MHCPKRPWPSEWPKILCHTAFCDRSRTTPELKDEKKVEQSDLKLSFPETSGQMGFLLWTIVVKVV